MESYAATLHSLLRGIISPDAVDAESLLQGSAEFSAAERLGVYRNAYRQRIAEALANTHPALAYAVGEPQFASLAERFIAAHPSRHFNLDRYVAGFARYAAERSEDGFARDLAALEGAIHAVYHAPECPPLEADWAQGQTPESLHSVQLTLRDAAALLALDYPVDRYLADFRAGNAPQRPEAQKNFLIVLRHRHQVKRIPLAEGEYTLLSLLNEGFVLAQALDDARMGEYVKENDFAHSLQRWFARWVSEGMMRQPQ